MKYEKVKPNFGKWRMHTIASSGSHYNYSGGYCSCADEFSGHTK